MESVGLGGLRYRGIYDDAADPDKDDPKNGQNTLWVHHLETLRGHFRIFCALITFPASVSCPEERFQPGRFPFAAGDGSVRRLDESCSHFVAS